MSPAREHQDANQLDIFGAFESAMHARCAFWFRFCWSLHQTSNPPTDSLPACVRGFAVANIAASAAFNSSFPFLPGFSLQQVSDRFSSTRKKPKSPIPIEQIDGMIRTIRGIRVMLDRDLAKIYGVPTKVFNQAAKRNRQRFPEDFMFRLTLEEAKALQASRSQFVTLKRGQNIKYLPYAFTEYGALMAANIGHSRGPRSCQLPSLRLRLPARFPLARVLNSGTGAGR
jgi:hypothetical protein